MQWTVIMPVLHGQEYAASVLCCHSAKLLPKSPHFKVVQKTVPFKMVKPT